MGTQGLWPVGSSQELRPEVGEGKWTPLPTVHTHTYTFFSFFFLSRSLSLVTCSSCPGSWTQGHPHACLLYLPDLKPQRGKLRPFLVCWHILGICVCHALCSLVQAALIPFYKEWREGISDWAMSSLDQAFDIIVTGGQNWMAS